LRGREGSGEEGRGKRGVGRGEWEGRVREMGRRRPK